MMKVEFATIVKVETAKIEGEGTSGQFSFARIMNVKFAKRSESNRFLLCSAQISKKW